MEANLAFVLRVAGEYRSLGLPMEDLLNAGNVGLLEAAHRFDHTRGTRFITYAVWWIRKRIREAISDSSSLVRVPKYRRRKLSRIREAEAHLSGKLGRRPSRQEISAHLQCGITDIDEVLLANPGEISLDEEHALKGLLLGSSLADGRLDSPEQVLLRRESRELVREVLGLLTARERVIVARRFGMLGERISTLKEIGESMGLTRERIRQIEIEARKKLRRILDHLFSSTSRTLIPPKIAGRAGL